MSAPNLSNSQSRKSTCFELCCHFPGCCWTPNQAGHTSSYPKVLHPSQSLLCQTNHLAGESMFVHIFLTWHSSWMDTGRAEPRPAGCDLFPHSFTPPAPQGSCIHTNKNRPNAPICCRKTKEKRLIYHSYVQNQINVRWSCIK